MTHEEFLDAQMERIKTAVAELNTANAEQSLRDWFAGMALQGLLAGPGGDDYENEPEGFAAMSAYAYADAMMKARGE